MIYKDAQLLLLSKFVRGRNLDYFLGHSAWETALGDSPISTIKTLVDNELLELAPIETRVAERFGVKDLKQLLKEAGLKVTGTKDVLIARLLESDSSGIQERMKDFQFLVCTSSGSELARQFLARMETDRSRTESEISKALEERNFETAVDKLFEYERAQVFPRGINMTWTKAESKSFLQKLGVMYDVVPGILKNINPSSLDSLRNSAAMMFLFGDSTATKWQPSNINTGLKMDNDAAARMFIFSASSILRMQDYKKLGVKRFRVDVGDDASTCAACLTNKGLSFSIDDVPEIPFPHCTCESGCRCMVMVDSDELHRASIESISQL